MQRFRRWFWRPPRAHGDVIEGRAVTALELFYDLVYVAVISQAAHHLADHVTVRGLVEFAIVFSLIWIGWTNGSLYIELHGREDGRTRTIVFGQMGILALLAVFTADASDRTGAAFALVYAAFLGALTLLWYSVRHQDRAERPELLSVTGRYVVGMSALGHGDPGQRLPAGRRPPRGLGSVRRRLGRRHRVGGAVARGPGRDRQAHRTRSSSASGCSRSSSSARSSSAW